MANTNTLYTCGQHIIRMFQCLLTPTALSPCATYFYRIDKHAAGIHAETTMTTTLR